MQETERERESFTRFHVLANRIRCSPFRKNFSRYIHIRPQNCAVNYWCTSRFIFHFTREISYMHENWMALVFFCGVGRSQHACSAHIRGYMKLHSIIVCQWHITQRAIQSQRASGSWSARPCCVGDACCQLGNEFLMLLLDICCVFVRLRKIRISVTPTESMRTTACEKNVLTWRRIFDEIELNNNKILSADVEAACWTWAIAIGTFAWRLPLNKYKCFKWNEAH